MIDFEGGSKQPASDEPWQRHALRRRAGDAAHGHNGKGPGVVPLMIIVSVRDRAPHPLRDRAPHPHPVHDEGDLGRRDAVTGTDAQPV
jgi:hypothetical protein